MPKAGVSVTLDEDNLLWLRGRAGAERGNLSQALDALIAEARARNVPAGAVRSVVGTVDISAEDPGLEYADAGIRRLLDASLNRPMLVGDDRPASGGRRPRRAGRRPRG